MILRVVRPYQPVDPALFHDLGPARGRLSREGYFGGPIEPLPRRLELPPRDVERYREAALVRHERARSAPRCGHVMATGMLCARGVHESRDHRSAESIERDRIRRAASR